MARIDVDIDIDDVYWDLSKLEKQELSDKLYDDGYVPKQLQEDLSIAEGLTPSSNTEQELYLILNKVWDNRMFINSSDLETLIYLAKKAL
jgi:hypothetical protein